MGPPRRIDPVHWVHHEGSILITCSLGPPRRIDPVPLRVLNATHLTAVGGNHSDISRDAISELHLDYISQDLFNGSPTKDRSCSLGPPRRIDPVHLFNGSPTKDRSCSLGPPRRIDPVHLFNGSTTKDRSCSLGPPQRIDPVPLRVLNATHLTAVGENHSDISRDVISELHLDYISQDLFNGSPTKDRSCSLGPPRRIDPVPLRVPNATHLTAVGENHSISRDAISELHLDYISQDLFNGSPTKDRSCSLGPPRRIDPVPLRVPNATHLTAMGGNHSDISRDAISELHLDYISQDLFNGSPTKDRSCSLGPPRRIDPVPLRVPNATHLTAVGGNHSDISRDAISELHLDYISQDLFNGSPTKDRSCSPTCAERYSPYSRGWKSL